MKTLFSVAFGLFIFTVSTVRADAPVVPPHNFTHHHPCRCEFSSKDGKSGAVQLRMINTTTGKGAKVMKSFGKPKNANDIKPWSKCREYQNTQRECGGTGGV